MQNNTSVSSATDGGSSSPTTTMSIDCVEDDDCVGACLGGMCVDCRPGVVKGCAQGESCSSKNQCELKCVPGNEGLKCNEHQYCNSNGDCDIALNCLDLLDWDYTESGVYYVQPTGSPMQVWCDMDAESQGVKGGWTGISFEDAHMYLGGNLQCSEPQIGAISDCDKGTGPLLCGVSSENPEGHTMIFTVELEPAAGHSCWYTFDYPTGYEEFLLPHLSLVARPLSSVPGTKVQIDEKEYSQPDAPQPSWTKAYEGVYSDVSFGSPLNTGPTASFADGSLANTINCNPDPDFGVECGTLVFYDSDKTPLPNDGGWVYSVVDGKNGSSGDHTEFRISWGAGDQAEIEGWYPWYGLVYLR